MRLSVSRKNAIFAGDMEKNYDEIVEGLLEKPCWVIDLLPMMVPQNSAGQFFNVEQYYLQEPHHGRLCRRFADVLLKLNCYHDLLVSHDDEWVKNPAPEALVAWLTASLQNGHMCMLINDDDALVTASGGDIHVSLYNPSEQLLQLVAQLAAAEGLFLWKS